MNITLCCDNANMYFRGILIRILTCLCPRLAMMPKTPARYACSPQIQTSPPYVFPPQSPKLFRTLRFTTPSYSSRFSRHMRAASTFAGLSSFGSANILITLIRIFSTL
jgi:hypothetical protein